MLYLQEIFKCVCVVVVADLLSVWMQCYDQAITGFLSPSKNILLRLKKVRIADKEMANVALRPSNEWLCKSGHLSRNILVLVKN